MDTSVRNLTLALAAALHASGDYGVTRLESGELEILTTLNDADAGKLALTNLISDYPFLITHADNFETQPGEVLLAISSSTTEGSEALEKIVEIIGVTIDEA
ncbi:hypothetical protein [Agarivorans sp. JK6]|uniref:hypothetical protein n=1 Tax=Agarivorans sp. JK6 TaxID=2997426 RepID=UPI003872E5DB